MLLGVNPMQLDVQDPNLRSKSVENLRKTKIFRDEIVRETDFLTTIKCLAYTWVDELSIQ